MALQLPFQLSKLTGVDAGLVAEVAGQRIEVDSLGAGPGIGLSERLSQRIQFGEVDHCLCALPQAEWVLTAEALGALPVFARPKRLQLSVQHRHLLSQPGITERLLHELSQLGSL